jgi:hypothetical protein
MESGLQGCTSVLTVSVGRQAFSGPSKGETEASWLLDSGNTPTSL